MNYRWSPQAWLVAALALAGCSTGPVIHGRAEIGTTPWAMQSSGPGVPLPPASWRHLTFPGKSPTQFSYMRKDDRDVIAVVADSSASMLRSMVRLEPAELDRVRFSWKVPQLIAGADMG